MPHNPYLFQYYCLVIFTVLLFGGAFFIKALRTPQKVIGVILLFLPILYFYWIIDIHIVDIPYIDDYDLLQSIYDLTRDSNLLSKIKALFLQVNQHRFAYERIVMWLILKINGAENIRQQIIAGNFFLLGVLFVFYKVLKNEGISWYYLIPISFLYFNLVYYENAHWGIASIQNTSIIFFALLSLYKIGSERRSDWWIALGSAVLLTFISGNGILIWIIGALMLLLKKRYRNLAIWGGTAALVLLFYFLFDYHFINASGDSPFKHPIYNLSFFLLFLGNILLLDEPHPMNFAHHPDLVACVILGGCISIVFFVWALRTLLITGINRTTSVISGGFLFVMGTAAMLVFSRPITMYATLSDGLLSRRYMIFGMLVVVVTYMAIIVMLKKQRKFLITTGVLSLIISVAINFSSYFMHVSKLRNQYEVLSLDSFYWKNYGMMMSFGDRFGEKLFWNHPTRMTTLIDNLAKSGIYSLPNTTYPVVSSKFQGAKVDSVAFSGKITVGKTLRHNYWLGKNTDYHNLSYLRTDDTKLIPHYFQLRSSTHLFLLPAIPVANKWRDFLSKRTYYDNVYQYSFYGNKFYPGSYDLFIVGKEKGDGRWKAISRGDKLKL
jgi:hypothetical protein